MEYLIFAAIILAGILLRRPIASILNPQSPIKTVGAFYHEVDNFILALREQGFEGLAEKIELAQLKGAVGSEIIGDIGLALCEVMGDLPKPLVAKAKELRYFVRWHRRLLGLDRS